VIRGSIRRGTHIEAADQSLEFDVPQTWVTWSEEHVSRPNLHLTAAELDRVETTEGEWDREFALVVNAVLPFENCVAHVGSEGWGPHGMSYADLQVRAYVLTMSLEGIAAQAQSRGASVAEELAGTPPDLQEERQGEWTRNLIGFPLFYVDYGATAVVDARSRRLGDRTVAFAFMYTDHAPHDHEIDQMLDSVSRPDGQVMR
jgi:hypothetical protein